MEERFVLNKKTARALSVDTRTNILKILSQHHYTLSDIAELLGLGNSTVKEHLDILVDAGLVKREKTTRKWKYYSLTLKGKSLIKPREITILVSFVTTLVAAIGTAYLFVTKFFQINSMPLPPQMGVMADSTEAASAGVRTMVSDESVKQAATLTIQLSPLSIGLLIGTIVLFVMTFLLLGLALKKDTLVVAPATDANKR
jgi:DNA-binding transcriptional ArsR family regulator